MSNIELYDAISILSSVFSVDICDIPADARLDNYSHWDSLGHMRIVLLIENKLSRELEIEEILSIVDLHSIQELINNSRF